MQENGVGGFNGPDSVITGCRHNAAAGTLNANSIHLHFQEQRPYHWWIVIIREWQSTETTEAWALKCVCMYVSSQTCTAASHCRVIYDDGVENERRGRGGTLGQEAGPSHNAKDTHTHTQMNKHIKYPHASYLYTNSLAHCDPDTQGGYGSTRWPFIACCSHWQHTHIHSSEGYTEDWALSTAKTPNHRLWLRLTGLLLYIFSLYIQSALVSIS